MSNFEQMHAALGQAQTAIREFLQLYAEQLPPERLAQLDDWIKKGLRVGLHFVTGAPAPVIEVTLVDEAGAVQVLDRIDFRPRH